MSLEFAATKYRARPTLVWDAVTRNGLALQFASDELRADRDFLLAAIQQNPKSLDFATTELRGDRGIVLRAVKRDGEALRFAGANDKARDFIGLEVHAPGVGRVLNALAEDGSNNVRVYHHDAVEVLENEIADGSLDEIRIYFPDPWHKKRHNKRRLVNPDFAALLVRKLAPTGRLHLATDWHDYAEQMWDVLDATPGIRNRAGPRGSVPRPEWRPQTHFETRGQKLGHGVWDLVYDRVADT